MLAISPEFELLVGHQPIHPLRVGAPINVSSYERGLSPFAKHITQAKISFDSFYYNISKQSLKVFHCYYYLGILRGNQARSLNNLTKSFESRL
jgi:hypothetical protein